MRKAFSITFLTVIFLLLIFSCKEESPKPIKKWTFLFYDDADFKDAYDPLDTYPGSGILSFYNLVLSGKSKVKDNTLESLFNRDFLSSSYK